MRENGVLLPKTLWRVSTLKGSIVFENVKFQSH